MSVEKNPNGTGYRVRWRDSDGRQRSKTVQRQTDARALDGELKRKQAMGELIAHEKGAARLDEFWTTWLQQYAVAMVTERTLVGYEGAWRRHIQPVLGSCRLKDLTPQHVSKLIAALTAKQLSNSSIRKCLMVLQSMLARAVEWRYIATNPAMAVKKPTPNPRRGRALSAEQVEALCAELDTRSAAIVRVLASTGLRPGELRALHWSDIQEDAILVTQAVSADRFGPTKNRKRRSVALRPEARSVLRAWKLASMTGRSDLVFPSLGDVNAVWTDNAYRLWSIRTFKDAALRAGLKGVVPYDLRHTFVSRLVAEGRDVYWVARQAGHSPEMALTTYSHLFESVYSQRTVQLDKAESSSPLGESNP